MSSVPCLSSTRYLRCAALVVFAAVRLMVLVVVVAALGGCEDMADNQDLPSGTWKFEKQRHTWQFAFHEDGRLQLKGGAEGIAYRSTESGI